MVKSKFKSEKSKKNKHKNNTVLKEKRKENKNKDVRIDMICATDLIFRYVYLFTHTHLKTLCNSFICKLYAIALQDILK